MTRAPRDQDTRELAAREEEWTPAGRLPEPEKQDGFRYKWVRKDILGETDTMNMARRRREGWSPVDPSEQESIRAFSDSTDLIEVGGLILCKAPEALMKKRDAYFKRVADEQQTGLSRQFRQDAGQDERMPLEEQRSTKVSRSPV